MLRKPLSKLEINNIKKLRETGHTLSEIKSLTNRGYGTVFKYIKNVPILPEYQEIWKIKRGGSKAKSYKNWEIAGNDASKIIYGIGYREKMFILSCLYWGEGNKTELSLINSDPLLISIFIKCLKELDIKEDELKVSLRLFEDIDREEAVKFWLNKLNLTDGSITKIDLLDGKKKGKLKYGMCRVRVKRGGKYFKLIISMINLIKSGF